MPSFRTSLKFLSPLLLVLLLEGLFRLGIWEPLANPASHAGVSIQLKRALTSNDFKRIELVTLGSSRPQFGIDHEQLAADARKHGMIYANASMPGTHWMTVGILGDWLQHEHPEIRGGIVALSIQDFTYAGNGDYELGIVTPLRSWWDSTALERSVAFNRKKIATYAIHSALFAYREDVSNLLRHPRERRSWLRYMRQQSATAIAGQNPVIEGNMCGVGVRDMSGCERIRSGEIKDQPMLLAQCGELSTGAGKSLNLDRFRQKKNLPDFMQNARDTIRDRLRGLDWPTPPIVVLMPTTDVWKHHQLPAGLHDWALEILQPLVDDGTIHVIDGTDALDDKDGTNCRYFADFYHQNAAGREAFAEWLEPRLYPLLFGEPTAIDTSNDTASH